MKEKIEQLLNVRPGEWGGLVFFWVFNTLLWTGLSIGEAVAEALFLKRIGVTFLPHMFLACAFAAIPTSLLFSRLQSRMSGVRLSLLVGGAAMVSVLGCLGFVRSEMAIGFPVLYIVQNVLTTLLATHFSVVLAGHYKTLDAKRLIPLILSGTVCGAIFGGLIVHGYALRIGVANLLLAWAAVLGASLLWFLVLSGRVFPANWVLTDPETAPKFGGSSVIDRLKYEGGAVLGSPLLVLLAFSTLLMTVSKYYIEYMYSDIFNAAFPTDAELARFFGVYTVVSSLVALMIQSFLTGRMIQLLGVSSANLFYPITTCVAFLGTALSYSVGPGIFARFNQEGLRKCVYHPVGNLLYNAIPPKQRARSITFNEGIVVPLGTILAGLSLFYAHDYPLVLRVFALVMAGFWIFVSWWQRDIYSRSLLDLLKRSQIEGITQEDQGLGILDPQTQALVVDALKDPQDEVAELAAEILIKYGRSDARLAILREAATARITVKKILISKLSRFLSPDVKRFLLKALHDNPVEVRLAALESLVCYPQDEEIRTAMGEFLEDPDPAFQATASAGVVRGGDLVQMMKALLILQKLVFSKDPAEAVLGIKALGKTRDERFWVNLRMFLKHPEDKIRREAMRAMNLMIRMGEVQDHLEVLPELVKDRVREIRSLSIQIMGRIRNPRTISMLIEAMGDTSPRNRRLAFEALGQFGSEIVSDLMMVLDDPQASVYIQEGAVKLLSMSQDPRIRERLSRFGLDRIRSMYELKMDEYTIRSDVAREDGDYFSMVLAEKAHSLLKLVLLLLAPDSDQNAARTVFKNLYSKNQEVMSNAIEVLQNMGERTLIYHCLPVLEGLPLRQIVAYGQRAFALEKRSVRLVLGRHLVSLDKELKEAAIYTAGKIGMTELQPAIKRLTEGEKPSGALGEICQWALDNISRATAFSEKNPTVDI